MQTGKRSINLRERLRYRFDQAMAHGTPALIGLLALLSLAIITASAAFVSITRLAPQGSEPTDFVDAAWNSFMHTLDPTRVDNYTDWVFRGAMAFATIGGLFVVSAFIGVLTTGLDTRLQNLRRGRSLVVERGHTLILGWSPKVFPIIRELVIANANERRPRIAILADRDPTDMADEVRARIGPTGRTQVICRNGNPIDPADIDIANPDEAAAIIILSPTEDDDPDAQVIKSIMALTRDQDRKRGLYHIVAEIQERKNMGVARIVGGEDSVLILSGDVISRLLMQTCRQPGLSEVYTELLNYSGSELYFHPEPGLAGVRYGEAILRYEDCSVVGLRKRGQHAQLNPPPQTRIEDGDELVLIAGDDSAIKLLPAPAAPVDTEVIRDPGQEPRPPERFLILGWNSQAPGILAELDRYVSPGSEVLVVADMGDPAGDVAALSATLQNIAVSSQYGDTTNRETLAALDTSQIQHVLVLCYSEDLDTQRADARTTVTLLHLRDITRSVAGAAKPAFNIVSQMLDMRNRELAEVARADDFIVSDNIISLVLAQVSENRELAAVFSELFSVEGSEIYLEPAAQYVATGQPVNFYTVVESARRAGETAIGYCIRARVSNAAAPYGVVLNPRKSEPVTFSEADRVIVLAVAD